MSINSPSSESSSSLSQDMLSLLSEPTSDERPDLGAFTTVIREMSYLQPPLSARVQRTIGQLGQQSTSTGQSTSFPSATDSTPGELATVWAQRRIASYLSTNTPTLSDSELPNDNDEQKPVIPSPPAHLRATLRSYPLFREDSYETSSRPETEGCVNNINLDTSSDYDSRQDTSNHPAPRLQDFALQSHLHPYKISRRSGPYLESASQTRSYSQSQLDSDQQSPLISQLPLHFSSHASSSTSLQPSSSYRLLTGKLTETKSGSDTEGEARAVEIHDSLSIASLSSAASRSHSRSVEQSLSEADHSSINPAPVLYKPQSFRGASHQSIPVARSVLAEATDRSSEGAEIIPSVHVASAIGPRGSFLPPPVNASTHPQREYNSGRIPQAQSVSHSHSGIISGSDGITFDASAEHRSPTISTLDLNSTSRDLSSMDNSSSAPEEGESQADSDIRIYYPRENADEHEDRIDESEHDDSDSDDVGHSSAHTDFEDEGDYVHDPSLSFRYGYSDHTRSMPNLSRQVLADEDNEDNRTVFTQRALVVESETNHQSEQSALDGEISVEAQLPSLGLNGALGFLKAERERLSVVGSGSVASLLKRAAKGRGLKLNEDLPRGFEASVKTGSPSRTIRRTGEGESKATEADGKVTTAGYGDDDRNEESNGIFSPSRTLHPPDEDLVGWDHVLEPRRRRKRKRTAGSTTGKSGLASSRTSTISTATVTSRVHGLTIESGFIPAHTLSDGETPFAPSQEASGPSKIKGVSVIPIIPSMGVGAKSDTSRSKKPITSRAPADKRTNVSEKGNEDDNSNGPGAMGDIPGSNTKGKTRTRARTRTRTKTAPGDTSLATMSTASLSPIMTSLQPPKSPYSDLSSLNFSIALPSFATALSPTGTVTLSQVHESDTLGLRSSEGTWSGKRRQRGKQRGSRRKDGGPDAPVVNVDEGDKAIQGNSRQTGGSAPIDMRRQPDKFIGASDADADESALSSAVGSFSEKPSGLRALFSRYQGGAMSMDDDDDDGVGDEEDEVADESVEDGPSSGMDAGPNGRFHGAAQRHTQLHRVHQEHSLERFKLSSSELDGETAGSSPGEASRSGLPSNNPDSRNWQQEILARQSRSRGGSRSRGVSRQRSHSRGRSSGDRYSPNPRFPVSSGRYSTDSTPGLSDDPRTERPFHFPSLPVQDNEDPDAEHDGMEPERFEAQRRQRNERRRQRRRSRNRNSDDHVRQALHPSQLPNNLSHPLLVHSRSSPVLRAAAPTPGTAKAGGFKGGFDSEKLDGTVAGISRNIGPSLSHRQRIDDDDTLAIPKHAGQDDSARLRQLRKLATKLKTIFPEDSTKLDLIDALAGPSRTVPINDGARSGLSRSVSARTPGRQIRGRSQRVKSDDELDVRHRANIAEESAGDGDQEQEQELVGSWVDVRGPPAQDHDPLIHVFIDHSNILVGMISYFNKHPHILRNAHKNLPRIVNESGTSQKMKRYLSHSALALLLERGRPISKRVLAASSPLYQPIDDAEALGYEARVFKRVPHDEQDMTVSPGGNSGGDVGDSPRFKGKGHRRKISGNISTESEQGLGTTGGGGSFPHAFARSLAFSTESSPTKPSFLHHANSSPSLPIGVASGIPRVRYREQGVDELLQLKLHQALAATDGAPSPESTIVLATGDGNPGQFNEEGFLGAVRTALRKGWRVELYAWADGLSSAWTREFGGRNNIKGRRPFSRSDEDAGVGNDRGYGDRFKIISMDQFSTELVELGPAEW